MVGPNDPQEIAIMPSPQHEAIVAALQAAPIVDSPSLTAQRANYEATLAANPVPADARVQSALVNGNVADIVTINGIESQATILYLHGGGYVIGSNTGYREFAARLARATKASVCLLNYRLAPEHPFPAALDDAVAAYRWLRNQNIASNRLIVAGDSAGGGLTLATLMALRDAGDTLPAGAVCFSPWTDLAGTGSTLTPGRVDDPLVGAAAITVMAAHYAGSDVRNPLVSPLYGDYRGLPPLLIQVGTREVLLDDSRRAAAKARSAGVQLEYFEGEGLIHVWPVIAVAAPESADALRDAGAFVARCVGLPRGHTLD
jgi:acetyl esterase/lipase